MSDVLSPVRRRRLRAASAVTVLACSTALVVAARPWTTLAVGGWVFGFAPAAFVIGGLLVGPAGVLGVSAGYLLGHLTLAPALLWETLGLAVLGGGSGLLAEMLQRGGYSRVTGTLLAVPVAATAAGSITAWGLTLLRYRRYVPTVATETGGYVFAALVGAGLAVAISMRGETRTEGEATGETTTGGRARTTRGLVEPVGLMTAWVIAASVSSVGVQSLRLVPVDQFRLRGLSAVVPLAELARADWVVLGVQGAVGALFVTLAARWAWHVTRETGGGGVER